MKFELDPQSYDDWKADRQAYLDSRSNWQVMKDSLAYRKYNSDEMYYGLADEIAQREESKIPIAGEGAIRFLNTMSTVTKPLTRLGWPGAFAHGLFKGTEQWIRYKADYQGEY